MSTCFLARQQTSADGCWMLDVESDCFNCRQMETGRERKANSCREEGADQCKLESGASTLDCVNSAVYANGSGKT